MIWSWIPQNWSLIWQLTWENAKLGVLSALYGLIISLPLGIIAARWRWFYPPTLAVVNVVYAVPSLALWIALIPAFGLTDTTVIIGLTAFSLCVILPNVVEGLRAVPAPVRQAATAMGYGATRRLVMVELPLAAPVIIAGIRTSVIINVGTATIASSVGARTLGLPIIVGLNGANIAYILQGAIPVAMLAVVLDLAFARLLWAIQPWRRA